MSDKVHSDQTLEAGMGAGNFAEFLALTMDGFNLLEWQCCSLQHRRMINQLPASRVVIISIQTVVQKSPEAGLHKM